VVSFEVELQQVGQLPIFVERGNFVIDEALREIQFLEVVEPLEDFECAEVEAFLIGSLVDEVESLCIGDELRRLRDVKGSALMRFMSRMKCCLSMLVPPSDSFSRLLLHLPSALPQIS
jgi:hypothetical protein